MGLRQGLATASSSLRIPGMMCALAAMLLPWGTGAQARSIEIENPGFEALTLLDNQFTRGWSNGAAFEVVTTNPVPGWTVSDLRLGCGTLNPPATAYAEEAPEGENVAFCGTGGPTLSQVLAATLQPNVRYTLTMEVGNRGDLIFPGYRIQLLAGGEMLSEDPGSLTPPNGTFRTSTIVYDVSSSHPRLGQPLEIRMSSPRLEADFDDVRLEMADLPLVEFAVGIEPGLVYSRPSLSDRVYHLVGRDSPFSDDWQPIGNPIPGTGDIIHGFERGTNDVFLPSRAWEVLPMTDGWSLQFDGTDDFAYAGHTDVLDLGGGLTIEAWVRPTANRTEGTILTKAISASISCYWLGLDLTGRVRLRMQDSTGATLVDLQSLVAPERDAWSQVAATYDGSEARLYINGMPAGTASTAGALRTSAICPLVIGSILGDRPLAGLLDEIRMWDHARAASEIQNSYAGYEVDDAPGLVGHWAFSEADGQVAADSGPNGLDLMLGDSGGVDATDPAWYSGSYMGSSVYELIWRFGQPSAVIYWDSQTGATYTVQSTDQPGTIPWNVVTGPVAGTGELIEWSDPGGSRTGFYRVLAAGHRPEGLYFGGLPWEPLRTGFDGSDGSLSSLPQPREGFNYGHNGNGRGSVAVTQVGDTSWTDYSLELDLELLGPDPAWNPYVLPACFRSGGIAFRVASYPESWNAWPGATLYSLVLSTRTCESRTRGDWLLLRLEGHYIPGTGWSPNHVGTRHELASGNSDAILDGANHVRIDLAGPDMTIWVNDTMIVEYQDTEVTGEPIPYGGFGVFADWEGMITVSNLTVNHLGSK